MLAVQKEVVGKYLDLRMAVRWGSFSVAMYQAVLRIRLLFGSMKVPDC